MRENVADEPNALLEDEEVEDKDEVSVFGQNDYENSPRSGKIHLSVYAWFRFRNSTD